jgi:hypothetical protein
MVGDAIGGDDGNSLVERESEERNIFACEYKEHWI